MSSVKALTFRFWDEKRKKLVSYRRMKDLRKQKYRTVQPRIAASHGINPWHE